MKLIIRILVLLLANALWPTRGMGQWITPPKNMTSVDLRSSDSYYFLTANGHKSTTLAQYDTALNLVEKRILQQNDAKHEKVIWISDSVYILPEKKAEFMVYYLCTLGNNSYTNEPLKSKEVLFRVPKVKGGHPQVKHLNQKATSYLYYSKKVSSRVSPELQIQVYVLSLQNYRCDSVELSVGAETGKLLELASLFFTQGQIGLLIKEQFLTKQEKRGFEPNATYFVTLFLEGSQRRIYITDNSTFVSNIRTRIHKNNLYFSYLYSTRNPEVQDSLKIGIIPLEFGGIAFSNQMALSDITYRKGKMNYNAFHEGFRYAYIDYIIPSASGITIILENFKASGDSKTGHSFYYGNIGLVHFSPNCAYSWHLDLPKNQYSLEDHGIYSGYSLDIQKDQLFLAFYDRPTKNYHQYIFNPKDMHRKNSVHAYSIELRNGLYKHEQFLPPKRYRFYSHTFLPTSNGMLGVFRKKGKISLHSFK